MATMAGSRCGCVSFPVAVRTRASSPSLATISYSFLVSAPAGKNVAKGVVRFEGSRNSRGLRNGGQFFEVRKAVLRATGRGDDNRDDAGVINDMELYLDDLSLEYDSVWDTKPAWCQPWTIVSTGVAVITGSWLLLHNAFLSGGATFIIILWWFSFLYAYPLAYTDMIAERRKMVKDGNEDTYGRKRVE